ncbi:MAG: dTMP kinase [Anaerolineae bacterium]|nr:dTMP kinase [Anaerolineae bacterium]
MNQRGKFIVIEGLDGSGITEQVELLKEWLRHRDCDLSRIVFTHEPSESPVGLLLRMTLLGRLDMDEETLALLFAADRYDHVNRFIRPALEKGFYVVSDRYYLSFYAYQTAQGLTLEWLRALGTTWIRPDLTLVLDTPLEQCLASLDKRPSRERYEQEPILRRTWEEFQRMIPVLVSEGEQIVTISGAGSAMAVQQRLLEHVVPLFEQEQP